MKRISVVVPVFNAATTLTDLVARLTVVLDETSSAHEIILVNDGSRDESWSIIRRLAETCPGVVGFDLGRNYGQQNALLAGIFAAAGDVIVTIDDDLDYRPEDIPLLLTALDGGHSVAYGRHPTAAGGPARRVTASAARWMLRRASPLGVGASAFRAFDSSLRDRFARTSPPHASLDALIGWSAARPARVQLPSAARSTRTRYGWRALVSLFGAVLIGLSVRPLQAAGWVGALLLCAGVSGTVITLLRDAPSMTAVILSALCILTGVQCLLLAVLGAYIGRIYLITLDLPRPVVRERVGRPMSAHEPVR